MGSLTPEPVEIEEIDYTNPPFPLTAIDRELLSMKDEDFHRITWQDLKSIIGTIPPYPNHVPRPTLTFRLSCREQ